MTNNNNTNNKNNQHNDNNKIIFNYDDNKKNINKTSYNYKLPINPYESDPTTTINYPEDKSRVSFNNLWR